MIDAMNEAIVKAMFETLPLELSVIDANDEVVGWNKHHTRLFFRPYDSMGRNFRQCHPESSLPLVEKIVSEMRAGTRDKARFWIDATVDRATGEKHKILIEYYALRGEKGEYLGCMECTQDLHGVTDISGENRLLDGAR
jgi:hypothetical protein